jgi:hypothetical protein
MLPIFISAIQVASHSVFNYCATQSSNIPPAAAITSYETALEIMLTCLGVMLTALAIGIGFLAIWGYVGLKDELKTMATRQVRQTMYKKLKEYPSPVDMLNLMRRLQKKEDALDELQKRGLSTVDAKTIESASNTARMEGVNTPLDEQERQSTTIETYPGEESHASDDNKEPPAGDP